MKKSDKKVNQSQKKVDQSQKKVDQSQKKRIPIDHSIGFYQDPFVSDYEPAF